jgi:hypothetical protein
VFVDVDIPDMPKQGLWVDEIGTDEGITAFIMVWARSMSDETAWMTNCEKLRIVPVVNYEDSQWDTRYPNK